MDQLLQSYPYLIPLFAIAVWWIVMSMIARISGWSLLAEHYEATDGYEGPKKFGQSALMERIKGMPARYNGVLVFGADVRGLRLSVLFLFRPFHPALAIPWSDIETDSRKAFLGERVEIRARRAPNVKIVISPSLAKRLAEASGGLFRAPLGPSSNQS